MASISLSNRTDTTLTVRITGLQASYTGNARTCKWFADDVRKGSMVLANEITTSQNFTISGLKANTTYDVRAEIDASGWTNTVYVQPVSFTTDKSPIEPFSWSYAATYAFNHKGLASTLTADEWNSLVDKVEEIFPSWNGYAARAYLGDIITASKFNVIARKVGYNTFSKGDILYGYYFMQLMDAVNDCI